MKKNLLALLLLGIPFILLSQKIESPRTGFLLSGIEPGAPEYTSEQK